MVTLERWSQLSAKLQIGNISSELSRAAYWEEKGDAESRKEAIFRALDLLDLSLECWSGPRRREFSRLREVVASLVENTQHYDMRLRDLVNYGITFVL